MGLDSKGAKGENMQRLIACLCLGSLIAMGVTLMATGGVMLASLMLGPVASLVMIIIGLSVAGGLMLHRTLRLWGNSARLNRNIRVAASPLAEEWIPMLYGEYTPYVVEAAQRLGTARETTSVPAMLHVLEQTVQNQPPGWCDSAEAIVVALGKMGDRNALPLLYRLTSWRGIGFQTAVCEAIDRIEPQTSLLRPGSVDDLPHEILLRPADACSESDPALLLRSSQDTCA